MPMITIKHHRTPENLILSINRVAVTNQVIHRTVLGLREPVRLHHQRRRTHTDSSPSLDDERGLGCSRCRRRCRRWERPRAVAGSGRDVVIRRIGVGDGRFCGSGIVVVTARGGDKAEGKQDCQPPNEVPSVFHFSSWGRPTRVGLSVFLLRYWFGAWARPTAVTTSGPPRAISRLQSSGSSRTSRTRRCRAQRTSSPPPAVPLPAGCWRSA